MVKDLNKTSEEKLVDMGLFCSEEGTEDLREVGMVYTSELRAEQEWGFICGFVIDLEGWATLLEKMEDHFWEEHYFKILHIEKSHGSAI